MPVYEIAGLNIRINPVTSQTARRLEPYLTDSTDADFDASSNEAEIEAYIAKAKTPCLPYLAEDAIVLTNISKEVLNSYGGCFFHSSSLAIDGEGYLFTALSGTGKSTHAKNWRTVFGDRVTMINDDKPLIRKIDGVYMVCSTPWMGKANIGCNMKAPIKAVYVLKRGEENVAVRTSPGKQIRQLMEATLLPSSKETMVKLLMLFDDLFNHVPLIELYCTPEPESAQVAYNAVNERSENDAASGRLG